MICFINIFKEAKLNVMLVILIKLKYWIVGVATGNIFIWLNIRTMKPWLSELIGNPSTSDIRYILVNRNRIKTHKFNIFHNEKQENVFLNGENYI